MQIRIENLLIAICILIFTVIYVEVKLIDGQQHLKLIQELNEKNTFLQQRIIDTEGKQYFLIYLLIFIFPNRHIYIYIF